MSETDNLIDTLSKMIVGTVDKRLSSANFDKSSQGVVTAKDGDTYTIAVFGGNYTITTDQTFSVGQKVLVTAPQGNMKNLTVSPGNIGTMKTVSSGVADVNGRLTNIEEDYNFAFDIIGNMSKQEDQQFMMWFNTGAPTMNNYPAKDWTTADAKKEHLQDLYYDKKTAIAYQFVNVNGTYKWAEVKNSTITSALLRASQAQDTADGKRRVFYTTPSPPYDLGDIWAGGSNGDILLCKTARAITDSYHSSDWVKASKYTDDTVANEAKKELKDFKDNEYAGFKNTYKEFYDNEFANEKGHISSLIKSVTKGESYNGVTTAIQENSTKIDQTDEKISLIATEDQLNNAKVQKKSLITLTAENITSAVSNSETNMSSKITQSADSIRSELYGPSKSKDNPQPGSVIQQLNDSINLKVNSTDFNGKNIINQINVSQDSVTIDANKINLNGDISVKSNKIEINGNVITADKIANGQIMKQVYNYPLGQAYAGGTITIDDTLNYTQLLFVFRGWYQNYTKGVTTGTHTWYDNDGNEYYDSVKVSYTYYTATDTMVVPVSTDKIWYQMLFNYPKAFYGESWECSGDESGTRLDGYDKSSMGFDTSVTDIMRCYSVQKTDNKINIVFKDAVKPSKDSFLWWTWDSVAKQNNCVIPWKIYGIK